MSMPRFSITTASIRASTRSDVLGRLRLNLFAELRLLVGIEAGTDGGAARSRREQGKNRV
jgi:hypothetical protein